MKMNVKRKKSENWFCISFRTLRIFWDQKLNLTTLEEEGGEGPRKNVEEKFIFIS